MGNNVFIMADEVQVGDNVWEHNIVRNITKVPDPTTGSILYITFNEGGVDEWSAEVWQQVMVTNR